MGCRIDVFVLAITLALSACPALAGNRLAFVVGNDGAPYLARASGAAATAAPFVPEKPRTVLPPPVTPPTSLSKNLTPDPPTGMQYGYIFANSDRVRLAPDMLRGLSRDQLRLARNEIYARRGRFFRDPQLAAYFSRFDWYKPFAWDVPLNAVEQANVNLIASMER